MGILERTGQTGALGELLAKRIDAAKDRSDASSVGSLSLRLAQLLEKENPAEAKATLYGALEWEPKNLDVLRVLYALHERSGEPSDGADVLERMIPLLSKEAEKSPLNLQGLPFGAR